MSEMFTPTRKHLLESPWGSFHVKAVSQFLQGGNRIKMSDIIFLIYGHKHSAPSSSSPLYSEHHASFSPSVSPAEIFHACPSLFSWATNLVTTHVHQEINQLSCTDVPGGKNHLWASMNGCHLDWFNLVTWQALGKLNVSTLCKKYKAIRLTHLFPSVSQSLWQLHARVVFLLYRNDTHIQSLVLYQFWRFDVLTISQVQVGAFSLFILSSNHFANGDLVMALGVWHFAAKSHINVKHVYSHFGNMVSDNTVQKALDSMTVSSLNILQDSVRAATEQGQTEWCFILWLRHSVLTIQNPKKQWVCNMRKR